MSHRTELVRHRRKLGEIRDIMDSMKILAFMETRKLTRVIKAQDNLVENIKTMALDFLHFYPEVLPDVRTEFNIFLIMGSQRGFCGNFNESLVKHLELTLDEQALENTLLIAVGEKLQPQLENLPFSLHYIEGANVVEETSATVELIAQTLATKKNTLFSLYVLHHEAKENSIISQKIMPPSFLTETSLPYSHAPVLNLKPDVFLLKLTEQYLFSLLHQVVYSSLLSENQLRIQHLENAVNHLEDKMTELVLKSNALRQEEIIEEIEVILLNASVAES